MTEPSTPVPPESDSETRYRLLFDNMLEGVAYCKGIFAGDRLVAAHYLDANAAFLRLTNHQPGMDLDPCFEHSLNSGPKELFDALTRVARGGPPERIEAYLPGLGKWFQISAYAAEPGNFVSVFNDISEYKRAEAQIQDLADHDSLTQLPNRLLFQSRFEQAIEDAKRLGTKVAMLFLDLDNFKVINDTLGHSVGDTVLCGVAQRLRDSVRPSDVVGRQGGDEFLILLANIRDSEEITAIASRLLGNLTIPFVIENEEISTSVSVGIAIYPDDAPDFDILLRRADLAMYHAKEAGRNNHHFFDKKMQITTTERLHLRNDLRRALERNEFILHYQPQMEIVSGHIFGAEALIRWLRPDGSVMLPGRWVSIAEESGLIVPIGEWVLHEAARQAVTWQKAGLPRLVMACNLSAVQFRRGNLEKAVMSALTGSGLDPGLLELELTESILIRDTENVLQTVQRLKGLGIKLSIDDFGTGYSSLAYLKRFAVDKLKIDQSFIRGLGTDPGDTAIVRAIIQMARSLGLRTIAEGAEHELQLRYLRVYRCDEAQGYHIARPMPANDFAVYLSERRTLWAPGTQIGEPQPGSDTQDFLKIVS